MTPHIGIVGAGIAGLHLGLYLAGRGVAATIYTDRPPEDVRKGRLLNTAAFGGSTRERERALGINYWDTDDFQVFCVHVDIAGQPRLRFRGDLSRPNLFVDMRDYLPRLLDTFVARGGLLVVKEINPAILAQVAEQHTGLVVASGRGGLSELFPRIPERCPFREPQRRLFAGLCRGVTFSEPMGLCTQVIPGCGEILDYPFLREDGRLSGVSLEAIAGGPLEPLTRLRYEDDPARFDATLLGLLREHAPLTFARIDPAEFGVLGPLHMLQGAITPTVRRGYAELDNGRFALALGDAHITHDPIGGQGANAASQAAWLLGQLIVARPDQPFDEGFCAEAEQMLWRATEAATDWSNLLLRPASLRFIDLMVAASRDQSIADDFAVSFTDYPQRQLERLLGGPDGEVRAGHV